jgi:hypothetical protein
MANAFLLKAPKKILLITKLTCGTMIANAIGNDIANICLLLILTCKDGVEPE